MIFLFLLFFKENMLNELFYGLVIMRNMRIEGLVLDNDEELEEI